MDSILRAPEVERLTGMTERSLRDWEATDRFPRRFQLVPGGRAVGWRLSEIQRWIEERAASREAA